MDTNKILTRILETIENTGIKEACLNKRLLIACSGGMDSMLLLHILHDLCGKYNFSIVPVHVNHLLRKSSTYESWKLKEVIKKRYGLDLKVFSCNVERLSRLWKKSIEDTGRIVRKKIFQNLIDNKKADFIAMGHHLDDQVETILFRLARGTGIKGLEGMSPFSGNVIRPLLFISKEDIYRFVKEKNIFYIYDTSNEELIYSRNVIRHQVLPVLKKINIHTNKHIFDFSRDVALINDYIAFEKWKLLKKHTLFLENKFHVYASELLNEHPYLVSEIMKTIYEKMQNSVFGIERKHIYEFINNAKKKGSYRISLPNNVIFSKSCDVIIVTKDKELFKDFKIYLDKNKEEIIPNMLGVLRVKVDSANNSEYCVRSCLPGDRYKSKKLKEIFLEKRIPREFRKAIPLLAKGSQVIHIFLFDGDYAAISNNDAKLEVSFQGFELYCKIKQFLI